MTDPVTPWPGIPDRRPRSPVFRVALSTPTPSALLVELHGELDVTTAPELLTCLEDVLVTTRQALLVLDLSNVHFLGAAGISALLHVREQAQHRGLTFRLVAAHRPVLRLLTLLDLTATLNVHASRHDALIPPDPT